MPTPASADNETFIPVSDYQEPGLPTEETFRRLLGRVRAMLSRSDPKPAIADDQLRRITKGALDEVIAPPACGPLLEELDRTVQAWLSETPPLSHILTILLPPCEDNGLVELWATQGGHQILPRPDRESLIASPPADLPALDGQGILVVPQLEAWVLRHRNGLHSVRALLAQLDRSKRRVVIGCNSWAWAFLGKAVGADLLLPEPVTFRAFDAQRLHRWFAHLAAAEATGAIRFRLPKTGEDVLGEDGDGNLASSYLRMLAGRSFGIPWVAWHMWRRSMRTDREQAVGDDARAIDLPDHAGEVSEQTLWVAALDEYILPDAKERMALLVLHALLIHGPLAPEHLRLVLPVVGESNIVPVLVKAGFLVRKGERFACAPAAYPAIRDGLASAGLPLDRI